MSAENIAQENKPDYAHADIALVAALPMELGEFLSRCSRVRKYKGEDFVFRGGLYDEIRIVAVECGMGYARARRATQALIDAHTPRWVISCGFSGALREGMRIGDIVMANSIVDAHGQEVKLDLHLQESPESGLHVGRILTADAIVKTAKEKLALSEQFNAIAVDLETLAVAQVCRDSKTRFMAVRVISDDATQDLPEEIMTLLGSSGSMRFGAAVGALWKRPSSVKEMWKLREAATLAADRLATFLDGVLHQLQQAK